MNEMTLDELEDLVALLFAQPGFRRGLDRRLISDYRESGYIGSLQDRYAALALIVNAAGQNQPEMWQAAFDQYVSLHGAPSGPPANPGTILDYTDGDPIFTDVVRSISEQLVPTAGSVPPIESGIIPPLPGRESAATGENNPLTGATGQRDDFRNFDPNPDNDSIPTQDELIRQRLADQRAATLAGIGQERQDLTDSFNLGERQAEFATSVNNFNGPLAPTRGNFNSGFQRQRRGLSNTNAGFARAGRRLSYQQQLRGLSDRVAAANRAYEEGIRALQGDANSLLGELDEQSVATNNLSPAAIRALEANGAN